MAGTDWNEDEFTRRILRLDGTVLGLAFGLLFGFLVFAATMWLVLKGGTSVGPHLSLLGQFFYGYSVSFVGSLVGLAYGLAVGSVTGWTLAWSYNRIASMRQR